MRGKCLFYLPKLLHPTPAYAILRVQTKGHNMKAIKTIGNVLGNTIIALGICAAILFITIQGFALVDKIREGCTTERSSETMNRVTCKSGSHYETR